LAIFEAADKDKSGTLTVEEFKDVLEDIILTYPQVELYRRSQQLFDFSVLWKDSEGNDREEIDLEEFKMAICNMDLQMKSLPATAQVCYV